MKHNNIKAKTYSATNPDVTNTEINPTTIKSNFTLNNNSSSNKGNLYNNSNSINESNKYKTNKILNNNISSATNDMTSKSNRNDNSKKKSKSGSQNNKSTKRNIINLDGQKIAITHCQSTWHLNFKNKIVNKLKKLKQNEARSKAKLNLSNTNRI